MRKQALFGVDPSMLVTSTVGASTVAQQLFSTAMAVSALAGTLTGLGISRATSPGEQEEKNYQKEYLLQVMQAKAGKYRRDKQLAKSTITPEWGDKTGVDNRRTMLSPVEPKALPGAPAPGQPIEQPRRQRDPVLG